MKNSIPNLRNFIGGVLFGVVIVFIMTLTVGCSKKDNGGGARTGFTWGGGYNGGPSIGQYVANSTYGAQLAVQFNSQTGALYGPVWANGQLYVRSGGIGCVGGAGYLAPGIYTIDPTNQIPGELNVDFVSNFSALAYGPYGQIARIQLDVVNLTLPGELGYLNGTGYTCNGIGGFNEMYGTMKIFLNGSAVACLTTYIDTLVPNNAVCL